MRLLHDKSFKQDSANLLANIEFDGSALNLGEHEQNQRAKVLSMRVCIAEIVGNAVEEVVAGYCS